jgi:hypothetical protein
MSENPYLAQLGRISGKLLTANLERNGVDLTFRAGATDPDLLYLDVNNMRIGVKSNPPTTDLEITGYSRVGNDVLVTGTGATVDNIVIGTNGVFSSVVGPINIVATGADAYVQYARVLTTDFEIETNYLQVTTTNQNLELNAAGTGKIDIQNSTDILGNLQVSGNISATGDIQLNGQFFIGDSPLDTVTVNPDFQQGLVSNVTDTYDLGSPLKRWSQVWIAGIITDQLATTTLEISGQTVASGNTITTIQSNEDLLISPDTGIYHLENLDIEDNVINNTSSFQNLIISHTGNGYLRIADTNALRIPAGDNSQRVGVEVGETRWNNEEGYLECFDGTIWQISTGGGVVVTPDIMEELSRRYTLIFG